jgi:hypothetical protein
MAAVRLDSSSSSSSSSRSSSSIAVQRTAGNFILRVNEVCGSHSGQDVDVCLPGCKATGTCRWTPTFRSSSSGLTSLQPQPRTISTAVTIIITSPKLRAVVSPTARIKTTQDWPRLRAFQLTVAQTLGTSDPPFFLSIGSTG